MQPQSLNPSSSDMPLMGASLDRFLMPPETRASYGGVARKQRFPISGAPRGSTMRLGNGILKAWFLRSTIVLLRF